MKEILDIIEGHEEASTGAAERDRLELKAENVAFFSIRVI